MEQWHTATPQNRKENGNRAFFVQDHVLHQITVCSPSQKKELAACVVAAELAQFLHEGVGYREGENPFI